MTSSMASPGILASSSNSSSLSFQWSYDVFLSFRGEDTRDNFISHLYSALDQKGINTYIDDKLRRGGEISPALLKAIEESKISIIIFSENYTSSTWCLDELMKILECKESKQQEVLPVFYKIEPSTVRHQKNSFEKALATHEKMFKDDAKVQTWKTALNQAACLSGWHLKINEYRMKEMDHHEALQLLSQHAFKSGKPDDAFADVIKLALKCAGGLPLALQVIGSNLYGEDIHFWKSELEKYKRIPEENIHKKLKISYDGLDDPTKKIFLDIACFFKGDKKQYVTKILESCRFYPDAGFKRLNDKCLITIDKNDRLGMHDLLQDMGREIVRQESPKEPGKRSRLYFHEDVREVLEKNKGTEQIEGILINLPWEDRMIRLGSEVFAKMERLRILIVIRCDESFCDRLNYLSNELRVLDWPQCSLEFLPSSFHGEKLIVFNISESNIRDLGTGLQPKKLTRIDLSYCEDLTNISDLSSCSNLKKLILDRCKSLVKVHDSIGFLNKLVELDFTNCSSLKKLPRSFKLRSLKLLKLEGCTRLEYFPEIKCEMEHLKCVRLHSIVIQELPSSFTYLTALKVLHLRGCKSLVRLPINIFQLERLTVVDISNCPNFGKELGHNGQSMTCAQENELSSSMELLPLPLPESNNLFRTFNFSSRLSTLSLSGSGIVSLPPCIEGFVGLSKLDLTYCEQLEEILHLPPNIEVLDAKGCCSLKNFLPESNNLSQTYNFSSSLRTLNLSGSGIVSLPTCIEGFVGLSKLDLAYCEQLEEILFLPRNIEEVDARICGLLERFPNVSTESSFGILDLKRLRKIDFSDCNKVDVDVGNHPPDPLLVQERFREKESSTIIYSGSRIPKWFKYCKETTSYSNSIEIEIDQNASMCFGHQIVALVLCFVVGSRFETIAISINGQSMVWDPYCDLLCFSMDPHRVCLKYIAGNSIDEMLSRSYREGSNIRFTFESKSKKAVLKSVGVHLICGNDNFINPIQLSKRYRDDGEHDLETDLNPQQKRQSSATRVTSFKELMMI